MDLKTLEYLEERAKKAREIVDRIDDLLKQIDLLNRADGAMEIYTRGKTIYLRLNDFSPEGLAEKDYTTEVVASIYNAFIDVTLAEIRHLEKQLAEL
jgi:hypothetical protein